MKTYSITEPANERMIITLLQKSTGKTHCRVITEKTDEDLFNALNLVWSETYKDYDITSVYYQGRTIDWLKIATGLHYCFGEGHISFSQFKETFLSTNENVAV